MTNYVKNIKESQKSIYDFIDEEDKDLYLPITELQNLLIHNLIGISLDGLPLRSRSKRVKQLICSSLGYPIPKSFKKTHPTFLGQNFDVFTQKSNNVQIWNEEIFSNRRYVFLKLNDKNIISAVKVITGKELSILDKTGVLTQKYQAKLDSHLKSFCSTLDTKTLLKHISSSGDICLTHKNPNDNPESKTLLPIQVLFSRLLPLIGESIDYFDSVQERKRGDVLHSRVCEALGYSQYADDGIYPDILNQLLEVKLQTSPTIDLGMHEPLDDTLIAKINGQELKSSDIRYAIFKGAIHEKKIRLEDLYLVTGEEFYDHFKPFSNVNKKLQIPLPSDFFNR